MKRSLEHCSLLEDYTVDSNGKRLIRNEEDLRTIYNIQQLIQREAKQPNLRSLYYGQRKLLCTEILFLTRYVHKYGRAPVNLIYAGAAPCNHIFILTELFPTTHFHLIDPAKWNPEFIQKCPQLDRLKKQEEEIEVCKISDKITVYHGFFTDELASSLSYTIGKEHVFISDIRPIDLDAKSQIVWEQAIIHNMLQQQHWVKILRSQSAMLKFRPTFLISLTSYLDGQLYIQPYAPHLSTECRLIVDTYSKHKRYDFQALEEILFYHNIVVRNQDTDVSDKRCNRLYDVEYEYQICKYYLDSKVCVTKWTKPMSLMLYISEQLKTGYNRQEDLYHFEAGYKPESWRVDRWLRTIVFNTTQFTN